MVQGARAACPLSWSRIWKLPQFSQDRQGYSWEVPGTCEEFSAPPGVALHLHSQSRLCSSMAWFGPEGGSGGGGWPEVAAASPVHLTLGRAPHSQPRGPCAQLHPGLPLLKRRDSGEPPIPRRSEWAESRAAGSGRGKDVRKDRACLCRRRSHTPEGPGTKGPVARPSPIATRSLPPTDPPTMT